MAIKICKKINKGFSLIEVLIAIFIVSAGLVAILSLTNSSLKNLFLIKENNSALNLAKETAEAVRSFRDETTWSSDGLGLIINNVSYYPKKTGSPQKWNLLQGTETLGRFTRKVIFSEVFRDANTSNIVSVGGTSDPNTKKATITVSWRDKKVEIITYFTNWR
ncbi:MAG: prepilin-type N-terminal cleavage/methylation domain-containing protein [Candidatus Pacebacteria bacterium]|nr:prepilin-type N-terminal cleavage/methylation domain-containing protein [Candidatus Paceibacterota bacterium]